MSDQHFRRRDMLAGIGAVVTVSTVGTGLLLRSTDSDPVALRSVATIPTDSAVAVTVTEYSATGEINQSLTRLRDGEQNYTLESLEGSVDNEYQFTIELGTNDESPELESLLLQIPE